MFKVFMYVHILSVMTAFGPIFTFPMIAAMNKKDPKFAPYGSHLMDLIEYRFTIPLALLAGAAGVGMIFTGHIHLFDNTWLWIAIIVYLAAITFAITVQGPNSKKMVEITRKAAGGAAAGEAPTGPPPGLLELAKKLQMGGGALTIAVLVILSMMVFKPGAAPNLP